MAVLVVGASQCRYLHQHLDSTQYEVLHQSGTRVQDVPQTLDIQQHLKYFDVSIDPTCSTCSSSLIVQI